MEKAGAGLAAGGLGRARVLWFRVQQGLMSRFQRVEPKVSCPGFTIRFKCTGYRVLGSMITGRRRTLTLDLAAGGRGGFE